MASNLFLIPKGFVQPILPHFVQGEEYVFEQTTIHRKIFLYLYRHTIMIARILESPIVDLILIVLAIRFIFPSLFTFKVVKVNRQQPTYRANDEGSIHIQSSAKKTSEDKQEGEYIDYEEVK